MPRPRMDNYGNLIQQGDIEDLVDLCSQDYSEEIMSQISQLITNGVDPNEKSSDGSSPICIAIAEKNEEIVKYLLGLGNLDGSPMIDLNIATNDDESNALPLAIALYDGYYDIMKMLLESKDENGNRRIHNINIPEYQGYYTIDPYDDAPKSIFCSAVIRGKPNVAKLLLEHGADYDNPNLISLIEEKVEDVSLSEGDRAEFKEISNMITDKQQGNDQKRRRTAPSGSPSYPDSDAGAAAAVGKGSR